MPPDAHVVSNSWKDTSKLSEENCSVRAPVRKPGLAQLPLDEVGERCLLERHALRPPVEPDVKITYAEVGDPSPGGSDREPRRRRRTPRSGGPVVDR